MDSHASPPVPRAIRVFVSSTFLDMAPEREELAKQVFPRLRQICERRGVTWVDVDLRWGIPREWQAEGRVLSTCLAEVERCRPFLLGLLGDRYGSVPSDIPGDLLARLPWLGAFRDRSMTEIEILHGVLNDPSLCGQSFFYVRAPGRRKGDAALPPEDASSSRRLEDLKDRIRKSGRPVREGYTDARSLGAWVFQDLSAAIDRLFPEGEHVDLLDIELAAHDAYARVRSQHYVGRPEDAAALDAHVKGPGPPLLVSGGTGSGKTALLASWVLSLRERLGSTLGGPGPILVAQFVGASTRSTRWADVVRTVAGDLRRRLGQSAEVPESPELLRRLLAHALGDAAGRVAPHPLVLVLDGLDQLEDGDGALELAWLPVQVPPNVRVVVSAGPGRVAEEAERRGWSVLPIAPLDTDRKTRIVASTLRAFGKALGAGELRKVLDSPGTSSPLYLKTLLQEMRLHGDATTLSSRIDRWLESATATELFDGVFERCEQDYDDRPGVVAASLSLLAAARQGLSEQEIREAVGGEDGPVPVAHWAPFRIALDHLFLERSGLLTFAHERVREAATRRYLSDATSTREAHRCLAEYFSHQVMGARRAEEEPWHLLACGSWTKLQDLLQQEEFLAAFPGNSSDLLTFWARIERESDHRLAGAYRALRDNPHRHPRAALLIAGVLADSGRHKESAAVCARLLDPARKEELAIEDGAVLLMLGHTLLRAGGVREAETILGLALRRAESQDAPVLRASCLGMLALVRKRQGRLAEAARLHEEEERIARESGAFALVESSLGNQGLVRRLQGDKEGALRLFRDAERHCRRAGDSLGLLAALGNQATLLREVGDPTAALELHEEEERIARSVGAWEKLEISRLNRASALSDAGRLQEASELYRSVIEACRQREFTVLEHEAYVGLAGAVESAGDDASAVELLLRGAQGLRGSGHALRLQGCLTRLVRLLDGLGRSEEELSVLDELLALPASEQDASPEMPLLVRKAELLRRLGRTSEASSILDGCERRSRESGDAQGLASVLQERALLLAASGAPESALAVHAELQKLSERSGDTVSLACSVGNQASLLSRLGRLDESLAAYHREASLHRAARELPLLARSLANQALLLADKLDRSREAVELVEEAAKIASGQAWPGLARSLASIVAYVRQKAAAARAPDPVRLTQQPAPHRSLEGAMNPVLGSEMLSRGAIVIVGPHVQLVLMRAMQTGLPVVTGGHSSELGLATGTLPTCQLVLTFAIPPAAAPRAEDLIRRLTDALRAAPDDVRSAEECTWSHVPEKGAGLLVLIWRHPVRMETCRTITRQLEAVYDTWKKSSGKA